MTTVAIKTYMAKPGEVEQQWWVVDADNQVVGRLAVKIATLLMGKHRPTFTPHVDTGDHVIIVNAEKVVLTAGKAERKMVYRHSGYPGGIKSRTYADLLADRPAEAVRGSIRGMLPKTRLGRQQLKKLKVYAGPAHPHEAQRPTPLTIDHARARVAND